MAFGFNQVDTSSSINDAVNDGIRDEFSKVCDALQFEGNTKKRVSAIEKDGYYREGFYMLNPFCYIGEETFIHKCIKSGILFIAIRATDDLDHLSLEKIFPKVKQEAIEQMPIVVFRNHRGPICIPSSTADGSEYFHCQKDTYEFIGVFKSEKMEDDGLYKLTKLYDRYYFDPKTIVDD